MKIYVVEKIDSYGNSEVYGVFKKMYAARLDIAKHYNEYPEFKDNEEGCEWEWSSECGDTYIIHLLELK